MRIVLTEESFAKLEASWGKMTFEGLTKLRARMSSLMDEQRQNIEQVRSLLAGDSKTTLDDSMKESVQMLLENAKVLEDLMTRFEAYVRKRTAS